MKRRYQFLLLALVIFAVFAPCLNGEFCLNDDHAAFNMMKSMHGIDLKAAFLPGSRGGGYYRPLVVLTFLFDKYVWLLDTRLMHFDNIFFHFLNALLVYRLVYVLLPDQRRRQSYFPLAASLLFALHPLTTESVNWISGRTDIVACTFVLVSALLLLKFNGDRSIKRLVLPGVMLLLGILVKESAVGFMLGGAAIVSSRCADSLPLSTLQGSPRTGLIPFAAFTACAVALLTLTYSAWPVFGLGALYLLYLDLRAVRESGARDLAAAYLRHVGWGAAVMAACVGLFFGLRSLVFSSSVNTISATIKLIFYDPNHACQIFFGACGFYLKKFFLPLPLNFAIREIDPLYNLLGVAFFFFCLYLAKRRSLLCTLFLAGLFMFSPALPLALGTVAWTAYAERYLYMPIAFWVPACALYLDGRVSKPSHRRLVAGGAALLAVFFALVSYQRSVVWKTNLTLFQDTVAKSPRFREAHAAYLLALYNHGDYKAAEEQYRIANALPVVGYDESLDLNMAAILVAQGKVDQATDMYEHVVKKTKGQSAKAYEFLIVHLSKLLNATSSPEKKSALRQRVLDNTEKLYRLNHDPFLLYRMGQIALSGGERARAAGLFGRAAEVLPQDDPYQRYAAKLAAGLQKVRGQ